MPLLFIVGFLILYGTLYPFNFAAPESEAITRALQDWKLFTTRGDVLGNIGLFVPLGVAGILAWAPAHEPRRAIFYTLLLGLTLAIVGQVLQAWVPTRNPGLADVFWNAVGAAIGVALGLRMSRVPHATLDKNWEQLIPAILLLGVVLTHWLPLVPSLDFQLLKDQFKVLLQYPDLTHPEFWSQLAMGVLTGHLVELMIGRKRSMIAVPLIFLSLWAGKLFLVAAYGSANANAGFGIGLIIWGCLALVEPRHRAEPVFVLVLVFFSVSAFAPFRLREAAAPFSWLPFGEMLKGSMLENIRSLINNMVLYAGMLYAALRISKRCIAVSVFLALWFALMEVLQTLIEGRSADVTQPILILIMGQLMGRWPHGSKSTIQTAIDTRPAAIQRRTQIARVTITSLAVRALVLIAVIAFTLAFLLKIPGVPYNVREMFRAQGSLLALSLFACGVIWLGAGSYWVGIQLAVARRPANRLIALVCATCLISLALIWSAVTTESIEDISGSANVFWFVVNKDMWGPVWREIFLHLDAPALVAFVEHCVRYSALYAPLPIVLGLLVAVRATPRGHWLAVDKLLLLSCSLLLLWFCKVIAFDWTSTDNLNELIAADGPWHWGGGGFLYGLLVLLCVNAFVLEAWATAGAARWLLAVFATALAVPLGWWLLNHGLEQQIRKYGLVFSGPQFLLGPDRKHVLSQDLLFLRWAALQLTIVMAVAAGLWVGRLAQRVQLRPTPTASLAKDAL